MSALGLPCSDKSLAEIAKKAIHFDLLWPHLELDKATHEAIRRDNRDNYTVYKHDLLLAWRKEQGTKATYEELCKAFEDWGNRDLIDVVKTQALNG